jgi:hypothetical protein
MEASQLARACGRRHRFPVSCCRRFQGGQQSAPRWEMVAFLGCLPVRVLPGEHQCMLAILPANLVA